jgi:hypothetical protein
VQLVRRKLGNETGVQRIVGNIEKRRTSGFEDPSQSHGDKIHMKERF